MNRGRDVSIELSAVRTVHSRAMTALGGYELSGHSDPEAEEIRDAMKQVVTILDRWAKTGTPAKRECPECGQRMTMICADRWLFGRHWYWQDSKTRAVCPHG